MPLDISTLPIIDHHCHPPDKHVSADALAACCSESHDATMRGQHVPYTLLFRRALADLAAWFECAPTPTAILQARQQHALSDLMSAFLDDQHIDLLLVDDGYPATGYSSDALAAACGGRVRRIVRLETLLETLLPHSTSLAHFVDAVLAALQDACDRGAVALKSIIAYRCGLAITPPSERQAVWAFQEEQRQTVFPPRLTNKPLLDFLLWQVLELCAQRGLPCQLHTGFGDADIDLLTANPLLLRPLLQHPAFRHLRLILLHAGYPYMREAGYLAGLYPQVYVGYSLAVPLAYAGMSSILRMLLELAPSSKLLYGSDGHTLPEMYWLGARYGRDALATVLRQLVAEGLLESATAPQIAAQLLHQNARQIYRLG
jgi:predicted TIM-barrel fold metal-dependent hydrolase